ncbi:MULTISPECIES: enoyl-CoA hydratase/isomerase family protein [unclassified Rhizobium]|uniref:enoyl-CoA hydratase/isomerase family protein n=1 Tax=unclassified Rhizobium TaxID=2613769 RepID=UPI00071458A8|nr:MULTISPECIES: enoyl-CoA hydratase/isomerase family protein [unclassified Rhizobium]KQS90875.1 3-hydroxyisobutyryl-CoA hydrolase [Rhizobium sp. Leaf391]KQS95963.1 3-hydroxyisobutyryl-CoA hydrolase [Rhizobium sp. Leaf386]KQU09962.1 3-hydroxyisobutyryl-CoA hydrolase [Rhizobium sp. Leaf453]
MPSIFDPAALHSETLVERQGALGRIRLNRPKALNSLTLGMVRDIEAALDDFERDPAIVAVIVTGEGERGLCAGGDIRAIYDGGKAGSDEPATFWREEYRLNARIGHYWKPYIAIMDGIVMGGGVGISVYGSHRVVTERTRFAMPETGIGFFPDIGASWFLTRQDSELGTYIALTGEPLSAADAILAGLADSLVPSDRLPALIEALPELSAGGSSDAVSAVIESHSAKPESGKLEQNRQAIDRLFAFDTVEQIMEALQKDGGVFAQQCLADLSTKSPLSLNVTLRLLQLGRQSPSLEACLEREFAATVAVLASHDFYEGVRAAVIDKDRNPQWRPARLADVIDADVAAYFQPVDRPIFTDASKQGANP